MGPAKPETLAAQLAPAFAGLLERVTVDSRGGYLVARIAGGDPLPVLAMLRDNYGFTMLSDLTAIDLGVERDPRFEVVYNLYAIPSRARIILKAVPAGDPPTLPSATPLFKSANWYEREVWDMFGISFAGHPNPKRIFMYESFVGHPLRKDYPVNRRQPLMGPADYIKPHGRDGGESRARKDRLVVQGDVH